MFARNGLADLFIGPENLWSLSFSCVQLNSDLGLLNGHNTLRKHLNVTGLGEDLTCRNGKECESSFLCCVNVLLRHTYVFLSRLRAGPRAY
jgi:hypothetical protein